MDSFLSLLLGTGAETADFERDLYLTGVKGRDVKSTDLMSQLFPRVFPMASENSFAFFRSLILRRFLTDEAFLSDTVHDALPTSMLMGSPFSFKAVSDERILS